MFTKSSDMLNKNTLGVKKCEANKKQPLRPKSHHQDVLNYLNEIQHIFTSVIGFVTWPPFLCQPCYKGGQVTKPIILVKTCYKTTYCISFK